MIGLNNADSSFFSVTSPNVPLSNAIISEDVVSLTIVEEVGKPVSGTILLRDENLEWPKLLKMGTEIHLSWGYADIDTDKRTLLALDRNPTEMSGSLTREGMRGFIMSPSGGGDNRGYSHYACNFYGTEYSKTEGKRIYRTGTKASVIQEVFARLGVLTSDINFSRGSEVISRDTQVLQWESDFRFLQRKAREWGASFRIGDTFVGSKYGMFVDRNKFDLSTFQKAVTGSSWGDSIWLDWKKGTQNVISYKWKNHQGESGSGDHVRMVTINGKTSFIRYIATTEKTVAYRFVPERITKGLLKAQRIGGITSMTDYMRWALNVEDFQELIKKKIFVPYVETTAPQGLGYSCTAKCLGNPMVTPPMRAKFGEGFPDVLQTTLSSMFIRRNEHTISKEGYKMSLDMMDTLTYTGGSFI